MKKIVCLPLAGLMALAAAAAFADENLDAKVTLRGSEIHVQLGNDYSHATLTIAGPNGFHATTFSKTGSPSIDLIRAGGTGEGQYTYQVTAASSETKLNANPQDNGRGKVDDAEERISASTSGGFYASGGIIVDRSKQAEEN